MLRAQSPTHDADLGLQRRTKTNVLALGGGPDEGGMCLGDWRGAGPWGQRGRGGGLQGSLGRGKVDGKQATRQITALKGTDSSGPQASSSELTSRVGPSKSGLGGWHEFLVSRTDSIGLFSPGSHPPGVQIGLLMWGGPFWRGPAAGKEVPEQRT